MSAAVVEELLARLYTDASLCENFLCDAKRAIADLALTSDERRALMEMDRVGLKMAASSYAAKRMHHRSAHAPRWRSIIRRLWTMRQTRRTRMSANTDVMLPAA